MLKVASDLYKMPLYRTAHSPENSSDEWAFFFPCIKFTFVVTQIATKSWIKNHHFFICPRVSARFLHCFCTVSRNAMGTLTCKIRQRAQKLQREKSRCFAQKRRKLESSKIRVPRLRGSFNQRARDSSSLEHTKIQRRIVRFLVGFSFFWMLAHLCTLLHTGGKAVFFPCIVCILCIVSRACRGEAPPSRLRRDRSVA